MSAAIAFHVPKLISNSIFFFLLFSLRHYQNFASFWKTLST